MPILLHTINQIPDIFMSSAYMYGEEIFTIHVHVYSAKAKTAVEDDLFGPLLYKTLNVCDLSKMLD